MKKVIAVMLLGKKNANTSVFVQSIRALIKAGYRVDLITNSSNALLFNNIDKVDTHVIDGKQSSNGVISAFNFLKTQVKLFIMLFKMVQTGAPVYISSVYPFAAAIAGKIKSAKVIYQLEEAVLNIGLTERFMHTVINYTAEQVILTSVTLKKHLQLSVNKQTVVYNALPVADMIQASENNNNHPFTVSMIAPLKANKGITEFFSLATAMPQLNFELAVAGSTENIDRYMLNGVMPTNLSVTAEEENMSGFFDRASVVVNLSANKTMLEPCDTNILQAMNHGKPVIVPLTGATKELINTKKHGVAIDIDDLDVIVVTLDILSRKESLYNFMSEACKQQAALFSADHFEKQVATIFKGRPQSIYQTLDQFFGSAFFNTQIKSLKSQQVA
jgi:glycosyltransferase involved in cell wall biosynthesis